MHPWHGSLRIPRGQVRITVACCVLFDEHPPTSDMVESMDFTLHAAGLVGHVCGDLLWGCRSCSHA